MRLRVSAARRDVVFANGTRKVTLPGGAGAFVHFANGDVKHQRPGGATEYFYAQVGVGAHLGLG